MIVNLTSTVPVMKMWATLWYMQMNVLITFIFVL